MNVADIIAILGGIGGLEFIKWLFTRKRAARSDEFRLLRETNEFLQTQQLEKEKRFAEQTQVLRATQRDLLETTKREADSGIAHAHEIADIKVELARVRCEDEPCPFRQPPTAKTLPKKGMTMEDYQNSKTKKQ